jgi:hypothetical protein
MTICHFSWINLLEKPGPQKPRRLDVTTIVGTAPAHNKTCECKKDWGIVYDDSKIPWRASDATNVLAPHVKEANTQGARRLWV